jgi:branched-chain amino acid transport system permease protein
MDLTFFIQMVLGGALLGGIYSLMALGMSLNLGLLNIMNLSHGSFLVLGAMAGYGLTMGLGIPPVLVMILVPLLFGGLGGILCPLLFSSLSRKGISETLVPSLLITLGLAFILEEVSAQVLTHPLIGLSSGFESWYWQGLVLSPLALIILSLLLVAFLLLTYFLFRTDPGRSLRALAQDLEGALLVGVSIRRIRALAWTLSLAAAGLAGACWVQLYPVTPFMGLELTVMSILMAMVAGPGQIVRATGAGFFWGILESWGSALWGTRWGVMVPLSACLGILLFFPGKRFFSK